MFDLAEEEEPIKLLSAIAYAQAHSLRSFRQCELSTSIDITFANIYFDMH